MITVGRPPVCQATGFEGPVAEAVREMDKKMKDTKVMTTEPLLKCFIGWKLNTECTQSDKF